MYLYTYQEKYRDRFRVKPLAEAEKKFEDWLSLVATVPSNYHTLTNDEWIAACQHFGKCALCHDEDISARAFFIAFKLGGRYANWNVIPVCEKCAMVLKRQQNPFIRYNEMLNKTVAYRYQYSRAKIKLITDYLLPKLKEAANESTKR